MGRRWTGGDEHGERKLDQCGIEPEQTYRPTYGFSITFASAQAIS